MVVTEVTEVTEVTPSPSIDVALQQLLEVARQQSKCASRDDVSALYLTAITLLLGNSISELTTSIVHSCSYSQGAFMGTMPARRPRQSATASARRLHQLTAILHGGASLSPEDFSLIIAAFTDACNSAKPATRGCNAGALDVHVQAILGVFVQLAHLARTYCIQPTSRTQEGYGNAISLISSNPAGAFDPSILPFHCAYPAIAISACISRLLLQQLSLPELFVLLLQQCGGVAELQYARMLCFALAPAHVDARSLLGPSDALTHSHSTVDQAGPAASTVDQARLTDIAPGALEELLVQLFEGDHVLITRVEAWVLAVAAAHSSDLTVYLLQLRYRLDGLDGEDGLGGQDGQDGPRGQEDKGFRAQQSIVEHLDAVVDCMFRLVVDPDQQQLLHKLQLEVAAAQAASL